MFDSFQELAKSAGILDHALVLVFKLLDVTGLAQYFIEITMSEETAIEFIDGTSIFLYVEVINKVSVVIKYSGFSR